MPTVVDSLVLEFGLDPTKFTAGQRQVLHDLRQLQNESGRGAKEFEAGTRRIVDVFSSLKREAAGLLALFFGGKGVKEFVAHITDADAQVGRFAKTTNMSVENLSAWQNVAKQTGGSAESMTGSMQGLTDEVSKFMLGLDTGSFLPVFNQLGISLFDANRQVKTASQLFLDLNAAVQGMDPARARALLGSLSIDPATINTLLLAPDALRKLLAAQQELGTATRASSEAARELQEQWGKTTTAAENFGRKIYEFFAPALALGAKVAERFFVAASHGDPRYYVKQYEQERAGTGPGATPPAQAPSPGASPGPGLVTITTSQGRRVTVAADAAGPFKAFLDDLESRGAPLGSLGGYNNRNIAGTSTPSEHAFGRAVDMGSMTGRDQIDPALRAWIAAHPDEWRGLLAKYGMRSGGDFRNPDLGHVEWQGWRPGFTPGAPAAATAVVSRSTRGGDTNTTSSEVNIGSLSVNAPNATDADGIMRSAADAIKRSGMAAQANYGAR
jgi:hypothetical protein